VDAAEGLAHRALEASRADMTDRERRERAERQALLAAREAVSRGVTSFHDQGASTGTVALYRDLATSGELPVRLYVLLSQGEVTDENRSTLDSIRTAGTADHFLAVRSIGEVSADGALGSRSAWMLEPYDDLSSSTGLEVTSMERVREISEIGLEEGYQVAVHAIGDRANRETLDLFEELFEERGVSGDSLRWRIEHAQHLHPDDIERFAELGVIASMQAIHGCSDAPYVVQRLGQERARQGAYVWKTLWESGAVVTNGTDAPVEDVDPIPSFHCTVTREIVGAPGDSAFYPEESLTREQALRSYTLNGAYSAFQEDVLGSLEPGKLADVVVLSRDIMTVPEDSIPGTEVVHTVVGGEVVYSRDDGNTGGDEGL
jgi:predicted amidohydrolase YtcJ